MKCPACKKGALCAELRCATLLEEDAVARPSKVREVWCARMGECGYLYTFEDEHLPTVAEVMTGAIELPVDA